MAQTTKNPSREPGSLAWPLARSFLRCFLVGANFNTKGLQNIGLIYAMEPGLAAIHTDPAALALARRRYLKHYNTHPFWTPLMVGIFMSFEMSVQRGEMKPDMLEKVKSTTMYTLSAIGDSFFGGSMLALWGLTAASLIVSGNPVAAVVLGAVLWVGLNLFKLTSYVLAVKRGFRVLRLIRKLDLINWGRRIKYGNCLLLALFWAIIWPRQLVLWQWFAGIGFLGLAAWMVSRTGLSRSLVVAFGLIGYMVLSL